MYSIFSTVYWYHSNHPLQYIPPYQHAAYWFYPTCRPEDFDKNAVLPLIKVEFLCFLTLFFVIISIAYLAVLTTVQLNSLHQLIEAPGERICPPNYCILRAGNQSRRNDISISYISIVISRFYKFEVFALLYCHRLFISGSPLSASSSIHTLDTYTVWSLPLNPA